MQAIIHPFIGPFLVLYGLQTVNIYVTVFSGTIQFRNFRLGIGMDNKLLYHENENQDDSYNSYLYLFIFLSLRFSGFGNLCNSFLRYYSSK